jgi:hypothetical protein
VIVARSWLDPWPEGTPISPDAVFHGGVMTPLISGASKASGMITICISDLQRRASRNGWRTGPDKGRRYASRGESPEALDAITASTALIIDEVGC